MEKRPNVRKERIFQGRVQGVGFRYSTKQIADRFPVTGYVRNNSDGTVQLVVEGGEDVVLDFLADVQSKLAQFIETTDDLGGKWTGDFDEFSIQF